MNKAILAISFGLLFFAVSGFGQEAKKIEEFGYLFCDDFLSRAESIRMELNADPEAFSYIYVYEGKILKTDYNQNKSYYVLPRIGEAINYSRTMRKRFKMLNIPLNRTKFILAGFREKFTVEFWLVPKDSNPPKPKQTLKEMKHRNIMARGDFCGNL